LGFLNKKKLCKTEQKDAVMMIRTEWRFYDYKEIELGKDLKILLRGYFILNTF